MQNYIEIVFEKGSSENELLLAALTSAGYEGFEQNDESLKAYIPEQDFDNAELIAIAKSFEINFTQQLIAATNWNAEWESGFDPVTVDDFVSIRAHFHPANKNVQHEILITPKMSFGTGHHATTWLMMSAMRNINFHETRVLDFGTGTGILAILAEKLGAAYIEAIDIDEWSIDNATENVKNNNCGKIELRLADKPGTEKVFDIILANINRNIILEHLGTLAKLITKEGQIVFSGLLVEDKNAITAAANSVGLKLSEKNVRDNWLSLQFSY